MIIQPDPEVAQAIVALLPPVRKEISISEREYEVLAFLSQGYDTNSISSLMNVSPKTTDNQRQSLYRKLKVRNAVQAARLFWTAQLRVRGRLPVEVQ